MKCPTCMTDNPDTVKFCGECGAQITPAEDAQPSITKTLETPREELTTGSTFAGRYQIIEELGRGGMGKVYKTIDTRINEKVAVKLIKPEIASDRKTLERFGNELKLARKIVHKNVGRMFDINEEGGTHYITMEYVSGQDLKGLIRQSGQLAIGTAVSIAKQLCEGLSAAHNAGVIHRDLKPKNIMIDQEGNVRIMDFGIARSLKEKGITGSGVMIGTPEYMSPEQVEAKDVDQRSDIYSLGIILYEMTTGQLPFEGETPFAVGMKHKSEIPKNPKEHNPQITEDLSRLILKCLEKEKTYRYQMAVELHSELDEIERGIPTTERIEPIRKTSTSKEITVSFSVKKYLIPVIVITAAAIAALFIWRPWSGQKTVPIPSGKPSLAVMYFKNNTGDEGLDHWRTMISDLLIADLSQSKYLEVLSSERLFEILRDLNQGETQSYSADVLKRVAVQGGVNHILVGNYARAGDTIRITASLQDVRAEKRLPSELVEGIGEESILSLVDELTKKIKSNLNFSQEQIADDIDVAVGSITTSSPDALKYYSEGRKYNLKGEYPLSISFMERAIAVDPEFAMAYRSMAMAYISLHLDSTAKKYLQKSFEFRHRVSERERLQIEGDFYGGSDETKEKAIEAYNRLLEIYPSDLNVRINLGRLYGSAEQWDKAVEQFETQMNIIPSHNIAPVNLAYTYMAMGLYDKAEEILESSKENYPDHASSLWYSAVNYLCQGQNDLALAEAKKAYATNPSFFKLYWVLGDIYLCQGDLITAEKEYQRLFEEEQRVAHLWGRRKLAHLSLLQGKFVESKVQFKEGIELARILEEEGWERGFHWDIAYAHLKSGLPKEALKEWNSVWSDAVEPKNPAWIMLKGLIHLELNETDEAQRAADEIKELVEKGINKKRMRIYYHLMGMIELDRENFLEAIEDLKKAVSLLPSQRHLLDDHAFYMGSLASAYHKSGDIEKARQEYEKVTALTAGRVYDGDIYAKSFYVLGRIYEQQGETAEAIEHYEKFLTLWNDADPGLPEVEDAIERVAGLKDH